MFFVQRCAACGCPGQQVLCHRCRFSMASVGRGQSPHGITAAFSFDGLPRDLIVALKFRHRRAAAGVLAGQMVRRLRLAHIDLVTWAPTSARRARRRGYDQAEAIARALARELGVPCRRLLYRAHGAAQTGRSRADRLVGPAFRARSPRPGLTVLVVDDVVTTGATLQRRGPCAAFGRRRQRRTRRRGQCSAASVLLRGALTARGKLTGLCQGRRRRRR